MKKFCFLLTMLFVISVSYSQFDKNASLSEAKITNMKVPQLSNNNGAKLYLDTVQNMFWNFDGALPSNWTVVDNTGNNYVWVWSIIGPHGAYTHPIGQPWNVNIDPIASTTGNNGFLLFQADNYNTDQTTGTINPSYIAHDSYIQTNALDLTGINSVILKFQQRFRVCCTYNNADLYISVSNDGVTWKDFEVGSTYADINYNSSNANDVTNVSLNISCVAANQSSVYIRFHIKGISHYYWMIDDVAITEGPMYDIVIEDYYDNFFTFDNGAYNMIPQLQSMNGYIGWRAALFNNGSEALHNVELNTEVLWNGNLYFQANSALEYPISSLPGTTMGVCDSLARDSVFLLNDNFYDPSQGLDSSLVAECIGNYEVTWTANMDETDQDYSNIVIFTSFNVNDSVYARDNGDILNSGEIGPQSWAGAGNNGDIFGVTYEITDPSGINTIANSISMYIKPSTTVGANAPTIRGILGMSDGNGGYVTILETDLYTISSSDTASWLTLPFLQDGFSEVLIADYYVAAIEVVDFNGGDFFIGEDITTKQVGWATLWFLTTSTNYVWFTNYDATPMIRLNFEPWFFICQSGINVTKNQKDELEIFPNPSTGIININATEIVNIKIVNMQGNEIYNGQDNIIDIGRYSKGVYVIKVTTKNGVSFDKVILN